MTVTPEPWNLTEPQRRQLREAQIAAKTSLGEPCPVCSVPMTVEDGLWYCTDCDAYHGEADVDDEESSQP